MLIEGPVYPRDLIKELGLTRNTVSYHLNRFLKFGIAKKIEDKRYAFIKYVDGEEAVVEAIKRWKDIALRYPTIMEIANETGIKTEEAEQLTYKTKDKTGWSAPNDAIIESAGENLGEILVCAARIRDVNLSNFNYRNDPEILKDAERFLKNHLEILPKLSDGGIDVSSWPPEALRYLRKNYRPKDRKVVRIIRVR
jgi:DNA-binding transcriptional ArsR family regulator